MWYIIVCIPIPINRLLKGNHKILPKINNKSKKIFEVKNKSVVHSLQNICSNKTVKDN